MKRPVALTPEQATRSPANRLGPSLDNVRGSLARLGMRPYRVFAVWTYSTADFRGEALEREYMRLEILPQPRVEGLNSQVRTLASAGILPDAVVQVSRVSTVAYDFDLLVGNVIPAPFKLLKHEPEFPGTYDFYYEIYEDGRTAPVLSCVRPANAFEPFVPGRTKWRLSTQPERRPFQWKFALERISEDASRSGHSNMSDHDVELS